MVGEAVAFCLLAAVLAAAVVRPRRLPEALVALPAAGIAWAAGLVGFGGVRAEAQRLWPVLLFLAAVLVLGRLCAAEGVFDAAGHWLAGSSARSPRRLLVNVFVLTAVTTCILSLDATVVLLTPVVLATCSRARVSPRPAVYATGHLANSGSLLLPMGNLTNLLALAASGLSLAHFAGLMLLPWLAVIAVEYAVFRLWFRRDLVAPPWAGEHGRVPAWAGGAAPLSGAAPAPGSDTPTAPDAAAGSGGPESFGFPRRDGGVPRFAVGVLVLALGAFVTTSFFGLAPYWVAVCAAVVLAVHALWTGAARTGAVLRAADVPFLSFVLALAVVVRAVAESGFGDQIARLMPAGGGLLEMLLTAAVAAGLANVVNNLPALLILLPGAAVLGPLWVLAVLIGVNVGPNLTYTGSLATLLWRGLLARRGLRPSLRRFTLLGLVTVPPGVAVGVVGLWLAGAVLGQR